MRLNLSMRLVLTGFLAIAIAACASPNPTARQTTTGAAGEPQPVARTFKRIVTTTLSEMRVMVLTENFAVAGKAEVQGLLHQGMTGLNENLLLVPRLAEAVPSVENGLWRVLPDGRMETTWRIREGARWHDGRALTADDLVFTARVIRDREVPDLYFENFDLIENAEAVDARTVKVSWRRPFIDADQLFGVIGVPLPKHVLEQPYLEEKASLAANPFWREGFMGTGPFKLKEWAQGSGQMLLSANEHYALGRPKIDEIEVRMLTDNNTMLANILASEIDLTMGRNLSVEQAQTVREQWRDGTIRIGAGGNPMIIYPGFLYADPPIVRDLRFRRAFLMAINRQELADVLLPGGLSSVAHSVVLPADPDGAALEPSVVKYPYDLQGAVRAVAGLGYTRGTDGLFRDAAGQVLSVEMRTTSDNEIHMKAFYPVIDYLKAAGIQVEPAVIPPARQRDLEYRAKITGFQFTQGSAGLASLNNYVSAMQKTAENGWRGQHTGYSNPEFDSFADRYYATIPKADRLRAGGQALHHMTDQLVVMTTFYNFQPHSVSNRLRGVPQNASVVNVHDWDL